MSLNKLPLTLALTSALSSLAPTATAAEIGGIEFTGSGFLTAAAGKMLGGARGEASDYKRPYFVSDYAQAGVYNGMSGLQWKPDSKLGLQGTATFPDKRFSVTGQVVSRGARDGDVNLEWLYASYKATDKLTVQVGRKRIPMFYYSDTQDVGLALPWVHLPSQLYGWEAVNYNGANVAYQTQLGGWTANFNALAGTETFNNSGYWKIYNGKNSRTDIKWEDILGGDVTLSNDWLETRFVYLQSKTRTRSKTGVWDGTVAAGRDTYGQTPGTTDGWDWDSPAGRQQIYGLAFNVDYNNFLIRSEIIHIYRNPAMGFKDHAKYIGVGYRLGKWTPMLTVADYRSQATNGNASDAQEAHRTTSLTLRYDLTPSSAIKMQYDSQKDRSGPNYTLDGSGTVPGNRFGDARLLTVAYDMVF